MPESVEFQAKDITDQMIIEEGSRRQRSHEGHWQFDASMPDNDIICLVGEREFAGRFDKKVDWTARPGGDDGKDFMIGPYIVNLKTASKAFNLLKRCDSRRWADIYVLAQYSNPAGRLAATMLGWVWKEELRVAPIRDFGYGIMNHYISAGSLRDMALLDYMHKSLDLGIAP